MNFIDLYNNVNRLIDSIDKIAIEAAMGQKELIADLNVKQLEDGKRYDGKGITPKYQSKPYANLKKIIGAKPSKGTPDLKLTGSFHAGFYAKVENSYIVTDSTDSKSDELFDKYENIFGLTKDNQKFLNQEIAPEIRRNSYEILTGKG